MHRHGNCHFANISNLTFGMLTQACDCVPQWPRLDSAWLFALTIVQCGNVGFSALIFGFSK